METPRDQQRSDLFLAALGVGEDERQVFLARLAPEDAMLRQEVRQLLDADRRNADGFLLGAPPLPPEEGEDHPDAPLAPETIGPFRLISTIGSGEHAVVYLAEQESPVRRRVALKLLRFSESTREVLRRFEQERRIIAQMDHPSVARFFQAGRTADGRAYLAMEHVPGEPITIFAKSKDLSLRDRLLLFIQACLGVEHAHQRGIIHRDLKPSNILAAAGDAGPCVKVIDFGIAKAIGADHLNGRTLTQLGQIVGTPAYMSPEQIRGDADRIDTRSDVYALGAVLYELLTEHPAVNLADAGPLTIVSRILDHKPRRPESINPALRGDPATIVATALEKDAERRYQSVSDLRADIERYLAGRPIVARPASIGYRARKFLLRNRALAAVCAVSIAAVGIAGYRAWEAQQEHFDLAISMAKSWFDQARSMARTVGERDRRRLLLQTLAAQSSELLAKSPNHPSLLSLHADVLGAVGDLEQERGEFRPALERFRQVLDIRDRLARKAPGDTGRQVALSIAHVRIGDALRDLKQPEESLREYRAAMEIDERTVARHPASAGARSALAWSCHRLGSEAHERGDTELSLALHTRELAIATALAADLPSADNNRSISQANMRLAQLAELRGDAAARRGHLRAALEAASAAADAAPDDRLALMCLIWARMAQADAAIRESTPAQGYEYRMQTLSIARDLAQSTPDDSPTLDVLYHALDQAADAAERAGDTSAAGALRSERTLVGKRNNALAPWASGNKS